VSDIAAAVTWLFVPGDRPDRFGKARSSGADEVICDLEDAVNATNKALAREAVAGWLGGEGAAVVRINAPGTPWHDDDVAALAGLPGLTGVMVPRAGDPGELADIGRRLAEVPLIALLESANAIHHAVEIAEATAVRRLAFGSMDFALDIDSAETDAALHFARSAVVIASRVGGKPAPIDGVTAVIDDPAAVRAAARRSRELGFGAKLCIHPAQLAPTAEGFRPTVEEIEWATELLAAAEATGTSAIAVDGSMVDRPVIDRARRILERAGGVAG
jgi:citrate lyase subunit beta/citryl-CoA lyase